MVKQERAGRTRQAVLLAAAGTFAEAGFEAASLVDISTRAGVSKGALYFHFVSKQALADGVLTAAGRVIATAVLRARRSDRPAVQGLIDLAHELAALLRENVVVRAGVQLGQGAPYAAAGGADGAWHGWTVTVRRQLERARASGELRPGLGCQEAAELLTAVTAGLVLMSWGDAGVLGRESVARVLASALPALVPADRCADYRTDGSAPAVAVVPAPAPVPAPVALPAAVPRSA
ncbi:ScbR family autoregulator-binding transcription factor [Kitasatospora sp. NPDC057223]|uniref:ScbR family autoregulator-binding transcription factor n=1 Tax=Kitasatospora sp. NPDC057223 TaxID=3346055 RepID=UPI003631F756